MPNSPTIVKYYAVLEKTITVLVSADEVEEENEEENGGENGGSD